MSYGDLQLARLVCVILIGAILIAAFGNSMLWWHIEKSITSLWWFAVLGCVGVYVVLGERMPAAREREQSELARRKKERQVREAKAAAERSQQRLAAREKALAVAHADYPQHFDSDTLGERGWCEEGYQSDLIANYLDPPEIVLRYEIPSANEDDEIRLYDRERVLAAEAIEEVREYIDEILDARERAEEARRQEEEQARLDTEEKAAEEAERQELERRLAAQKVIRIDDRLK